MIWKIPDSHFLVQGEMRPIPMNTTIRLPDGGIISSAATYYLFNATGQVKRKFLPPSIYSLDDTLGISDIHAVVGDTLYSFHWIDHAMNDPIVKEEIELIHLRPVGLQELSFDPLSMIAAYEKNL